MRLQARAFWVDRATTLSRNSSCPLRLLVVCEALPRGLLADAEGRADARPACAALAKDADVDSYRLFRRVDARGVGGQQPEHFVVAQAAPVEKGGFAPSSARTRLQSSTQPSQMYTPAGPAMSFATSFELFRQKEQFITVGMRITPSRFP